MHDLISKFSNSRLILLALFVVTIIAASPLLYNANLPANDSTSHLFKSWLIRYELDNFGKVFDWNQFWYAGSPAFRFYPPLAYFAVAGLSYLIPLPIYTVYKLSIVLSYLLLAFSTYYLARTLKFSKILSAVISALTVTSPLVASATGAFGWIPTMFAFSFLPLALAFVIKSFETHKLREIVIASLLTSIIILTHHVTAYFLLFIILLIYFGKIIFIEKNSLRKNSRTLAYFGILVFLLTMSWTIPLISEFEFSNFQKTTFTIDPVQAFLTFVSSGCRTFSCLTSITPELLSLALIGFALTFISISADQNKIHFVPTHDKNYLYIFLVFIGSLVILFSPIFGLNKLIPFGESVDYGRFALFLLPSLALLAGIFVNKIPNYKIILLLLISAIIFYHMFLSVWRLEAYLLEDSVLPHPGVKDPYEPLRRTTEGRVQTYGLFGPGIVSALPMMTQKQMISGWYHQGSYNYPQLAGKIEDLNYNKFVENITKEEFYKILDRGFVKYILLVVCNVEGQNVVHLLADFKLLEQVNDCMGWIENDRTIFFTDPSYNWTRQNPEEITIYNTIAGKILVKETYYPHWNAYCDGEKLNTEKEYDGLMMVNAKKDCNELKMKYELSFTYTILFYGSVSTFFVLALYLLGNMLIPKLKIFGTVKNR